MARRIRAREVLRLRSVNGLPQNAIAPTAHVSKHSVQDALVATRERVAAGQAGHIVQVDDAGANGAEVRHRLDRLCTQFKKKDWHPRLGGGVHADAIMNRIVHNAVWVDMGEANMRQRRG